MSNKRSEQIKKVHEKRKNETEEKILNAINELLAEGVTINFNSVAEKANVSTRTLYNKPAIAEKISELRNHNVIKKRTSDDNKDAIIASLKRKLAKIEKENAELKLQLNGKYVDLYEQS